jgi:hypothetical protein
MTIPIFCVRNDSIYKSISNTDCFDKDRNFYSYKGNSPAVAHPPCRAWGRLRNFVTPLPGEKKLAIDCVRYIQRNGGVIEHPYSSRLWPVLDLPGNGETDKYGGITLIIDQFWFGHKARKTTKLYIVGLSFDELPPIPIDLAYPQYVVAGHSSSRHKPNALKEITKAEREHTPLDLAYFLIEIANTINSKRLSEVA